MCLNYDNTVYKNPGIYNVGTVTHAKLTFTSRSLPFYASQEAKMHLLLEAKQVRIFALEMQFDFGELSGKYLLGRR